MNRKIIYSGLIGIVLCIVIVAFVYYSKIFGTAVKEDKKIFIASGFSYNNLKSSVLPMLSNGSDFDFVAKLKRFSTPKGGMYLLKKGMSMNDVINILRSGNQTPIKVSFNNQDTVEKLAGRIANQLETDSITLLKTMIAPDFLQKNNFTKKSVLAMYIPNQYEFYWTDSAEKFRNKMLKYYHLFWNKTRLNKAKNIGLTKDEVIVLASIVQKETAQPIERPIVAGLYLNRLKTKGWKLEADPTLIFALKELHGHDIVIKRVLNKDKKINSPYNTYKNSGLPPSLIAMPDISAIDAVLNPAKHNYFFMCASTQKIGFHEFAKTLAQHNRNARKYQQWITEQGINR